MFRLLTGRRLGLALVAALAALAGPPPCQAQSVADYHSRADQALQSFLLKCWDGGQQYLRSQYPSAGTLTGYWTYAQDPTRLAYYAVLKACADAIWNLARDTNAAIFSVSWAGPAQFTVDEPQDHAQHPADTSRNLDATSAVGFYSDESREIVLLWLKARELAVVYIVV